LQLAYSIDFRIFSWRYKRNSVAAAFAAALQCH
jgi:hypothetical protein